MARKGENIYRRKDGRWEARYIKGYELSGKIKYGSCYGKSYKEAKEKVLECKAALIHNDPLPTAVNRKRFASFCLEWLQLAKGKVKESTYVKYETVVNKHILPKLGGCFPLGINSLTAERFKQELLEEGLAVKTVRDILTILRSVLKYTAQQFPHGFKAVEINYPREIKKEARVLSVAEQRRLIAFLKTDIDPCKFGILLAMMTGLRIGELCALQWQNISLKERTLKVDSTMQRIKDLKGESQTKTRIMIGHPKSDTSVRIIPLNTGTAQLCNKFDPHDPSAYILTGNDHYMEPRQLQKRLAKYTKECNLADVHFHTIRHTFATRCVEAGFEIKSLSEILGHANTTITLNRYVHSSLKLKRMNMAKLDMINI